MYKKEVYIINMKGNETKTTEKQVKLTKMALITRNQSHDFSLNLDSNYHVQETVSEYSV